MDGKDEDSFKAPPIESEEDWEKMKLTVFENAKKAATLISTISDEQLLENSLMLNMETILEIFPE